jgi:ribosomal protein L24E
MPRDSESKFYIDECLDSDHFIDPLRGGGLKVVRHREMLEWGVPDEVWIREVSKAGYFVITEDYKIMRNANQSELIMNNRLGLFIVRCKGSSHSEKGKLVVQNSAKLLRFIKKNSRPFIATITRSGVNGRRPRDRNWGQKYLES